METITLHHNTTAMSYGCSIRTASRVDKNGVRARVDEKYLHGRVWIEFVKDQQLKKGDILKMEIRDSPLTIFIDVVRA